jgi:DNA replication protein DnaD
MSSVAEIESAIERLSPTQVEELAAWLDQYREMIHASGEVFAVYDREDEAR